MKDSRVLIGAEGWQHAQWQGGFYPEDLPTDWQLAYYSNEFAVALIPAAYWPQGPVAVTSWVAESSETLRFIAEWPPQWHTPALIEQGCVLLEHLGDRVLGVLVPLSVPTAAIMQAVIERLQTRYRVCLDYGEDIPAPLLTAAGQFNNELVSVCWHGSGDGKILQQGPLALVRIECKGLTLRDVRRVLDACLAAQDPQRYLLVIFAGKPPDVTLMQQAKVMLDMM
jgi:hypothetical protein